MNKNVPIKRILVAVTGLSPQVVTETLYALTVQQEPAFVPDEIYVITTEEGKRRAAISLLDSKAGHFHRFCNDYGFTDRIRFDVARILTITDETGTPLNDINTPEDNALAADFITGFFRNITQDEQSIIHASLAGGRKTLGFYVGYALSLYGRPQDQLSHVLVSPEFESHPEFFYPPTEPVVLYTRDAHPKAISTKDAKITLANIPFVPLRDGIPKTFLQGKACYADIIEATRQQLKPPSVYIDLDQKLLRCGEVDVRIKPAHLAFYAWFAKRAQTLPEEEAGLHDTETDQDIETFLVFRETQEGLSTKADTVDRTFEQGFSADYFSQYKTEVNKAIKTALPFNYSPYLLVSAHQVPGTRYMRTQLLLKPEQIDFGG